MTSSFAGSIEHGSSSSSSHGPAQHVIIEDDSDDDDRAVSHSRDQKVFSDDPFDVGEEETISFKRKQKQTAGSRLLSALSGNPSSSQQSSSSPRSGTPTTGSHRLNTHGGGSSNDKTTKDDGPLDWYVEGPGRRVGYEDMTAIDWIFEYTKERQRLRMLYSNATGLLGHIQQIFDASQIWVLLILTGISAGIFAAGIDIVSDWLGDLKTGYCSSGVDGGRFYLNKYFCCYGYDEFAKCQDWVSWSLALQVTSAGGKWLVEYFFFIIFSVGTIYSLSAPAHLICTACICTGR